jgi:cytidylate kinase
MAEVERSASMPRLRSSVEAIFRRMGEVVRRVVADGRPGGSY